MVSCTVCEPLVVELRSRGFEPELLVESLPCDIATLEDRRKTIPWDVFTVILERTAKLLGGKEALEDLAFRHTMRSLPSLIRGLLPAMTRSKPLFLEWARSWRRNASARSPRSACSLLGRGTILHPMCSPG